MAITNSNSYGSLSKYLPTKVIGGQSTKITSLQSWLYDDGTGDPWWQGAAGVPFMWTLTANISQVSHSSHLTRQAYVYNGLDISPGMWVCSAADSISVQIISISSQTANTITCVVMDVDRHNTFRDPSGNGNGIFSYPSNIIFYELGDDGLPKIDPLPVVADPILMSQIEARFRVFNSNTEYQFYQINHGFVEGSVLKLNPTTKQFENSTSTDIFRVGTVTSVGPGPNYFYMAPTTKFISNLEPGLPGQVGSVIWLDPSTGSMTTVPNSSKVPLYIQMTAPVSCFTIGTVDNPTTIAGNVSTINKVTITFSGSGTLSTSTIINAINALTPQHGVTATMGSPVTTVTGSIAGPNTSVNPNMVFTVNGITTTVTTPSIVYGNTNKIGWWDFIKAINEQTSLHGVFASLDPNTSKLVFTNASGGNINFTNVTPATTSGSYATFTDAVGIPLTNASAAATKLKLVRSDGGQIIVSDVTGTFFESAGIQSAANGILPLALVVDQAMYANSSYMVNTVADRDALTNLRSGDQVYVQADIDGEWALYIKIDTGWTKIATADSASTDAKTLQVDIQATSTSPILLGNIGSGTRIVDVSITVNTPFAGSAPAINIGTSTIQNAVFDSSDADLTVSGTYETPSSFVASTSDGTDVAIYAYLTGVVSTGDATVIISYL
jgi:hypothetical protein